MLTEHSSCPLGQAWQERGVMISPRAESTQPCGLWSLLQVFGSKAQVMGPCLPGPTLGTPCCPQALPSAQEVSPALGHWGMEVEGKGLGN